ncbi:MAG: hypothetical protein IKE30_00530 [Clostridia bacterium]|nr:hypothetical protein [Clostridia bacterium]
MTIHVNIQRIGRKRPVIQPLSVELSGIPHTLAELIALCVEAWAAQRSLRAADNGKRILSQDSMDDLAAAGKITFGPDTNSAPADKSGAVANAVQSYRDGLFRVFLNGQELRELDAPLQLTEQCTVTFVRLTMLAGAPWFL